MQIITIFFSLVLITQIKSQSIIKAKTASTEEINKSILNMRKGDGTGTGMFLVNNGETYIVTASHVANMMDESSYIIIQGDRNQPIKLQLKELSIPINWIHHSEADISILKIYPSVEINNKYLLDRFVPMDMIDSTKNNISRNKLLMIFGFPRGLGAEGYFSPLTYRSYPASGLITLLRFDIQTPQAFFILENPSVGGYSGGPVIDLGVIETPNSKSIYGPTKIHGFIHGTISDSTGGKLTAFTPAFYLYDFFKK